MDIIIFFAEILSLITIGISIFLEGEAHTISIYIAGIFLAISLLYNGLFICNCVGSLFGRKCAK